MDTNQKLFVELVDRLKTKYNDEVDLIGYCSYLCESSEDEIYIIIIMKESSAEIIDYSFVVEDEQGLMGYKLKSMSWREYEQLVGTVDAAKIIHFKPLYSRDGQAFERYRQLKRCAEKYLVAPLDKFKIERIKPLVSELKSANSDALTADKENVKYYAIKLLFLSVRCLTEINSVYYRYSEFDRIKDIDMLSIVPKDYKLRYKTIIDKNDEKELKNACVFITKAIVEIFDKLQLVYRKNPKKKYDCAFEQFVAKTSYGISLCKLGDEKKFYSVSAYKIKNALYEVYFNSGLQINNNVSNLNNCAKHLSEYQSIVKSFENEYQLKRIKIKKFDSIVDALKNI